MIKYFINYDLKGMPFVDYADFRDDPNLDPNEVAAVHDSINGHEPKMEKRRWF